MLGIETSANQKCGWPAWREGGDASSLRDGRREGETRIEGGTNVPDISASQFAGGGNRGRRDHAIGQ